MKKSSTIFLRVVIFLVGAIVFAFGILGLFLLIMNPANPNYAYILYPISIDIYLSVIPFFIALHQTFKLLNYIDKNQSFSELSVKALKNIKLCAITISGLYMVIMPLIYLVADLDDAPGLVIIGMIPAFASMVIAVFATVLQNLLKSAIDIKLENDLTV